MPRCARKNRFPLPPQVEAPESFKRIFSEWARICRSGGYIVLFHSELKYFNSLPGHEQLYVGPVAGKYTTSSSNPAYEIRWREGGVRP